MTTDEILLQVLQQLKELNENIKGNTLTTCQGKEALKILGLKDPRQLTALSNQGLLNRRGGGKGGFVYYKAELNLLAEKIRQGVVEVPRMKLIYNKAS